MNLSVVLTQEQLHLLCSMVDNKLDAAHNTVSEDLDILESEALEAVDKAREDIDELQDLRAALRNATNRTDHEEVMAILQEIRSIKTPPEVKVKVDVGGPTGILIKGWLPSAKRGEYGTFPKIGLLKAVRSYTGLDLKTSKDMIDRMPVEVNYRHATAVGFMEEMRDLGVDYLVI